MRQEIKNRTDLISGKRYWFRDRECIYSGLYGGEIDEHNGNAILQRRNGDRWSIPLKDLYATSREAQGNIKYCIMKG